jgi:cytochrome c-type protein NapC
MTDSERPARTGKGRVFGLGALTVAFVLGIVFWGGFNTAMEWTNTESFCISCHEMYENVYVEYQDTIHYENRTGVRATCPDCHVPKEWVHKMVRKIQASNELLHKALGTIDTPEKFEAKRLQLAQNVWRNEGKTCIDCHKGIAHRPPKMPDNAQVSQAR